MWNATPSERGWSTVPNITRGPAAATHCGLIADSMLDFESISSVQIEDWSRWLSTGNPVECEERIRQSTFTGRPCGNESFVREAERRLGRHLAPQKPGRKPKVAVAADTLWTTDEIRR